MNNQEARQHIIGTTSEESYPVTVTCSMSFFKKMSQYPYIKFLYFCKPFTQYNRYVAYAKNVKGKKVYVVYGDGTYLGKFKRTRRMTQRDLIMFKEKVVK